MEIGYIWLALGLVFSLLATGAAVVLATVSFPLMRNTREADFPVVFRRYMLRRLWSFELLGLLACAFLLLLLFRPVYALPEWLPLWIGAFLLAITLLVVVWVAVAWPVLRGTEPGRRIRMLAALHTLDAVLWLATSCVLVEAFLEVVGFL